jgi:hypothetical protein
VTQAPKIDGELQQNHNKTHNRIEHKENTKTNWPPEQDSIAPPLNVKPTKRTSLDACFLCEDASCVLAAEALVMTRISDGFEHGAAEPA